ncbi:MAG TPA: PKD domain-containing protein [Candidatus Thermoplasmatota archaeon]|jgi:PKD repeat protein|nr:PKD domain-containing protein [Candidatus Thermoplasmatota archaeon]
MLCPPPPQRPRWRGPAVALAALLIVPAGVLVMGPAAATGAPLLVGMDTASLQGQTDAGVKPDYASFWVGVWNLKYGWGGPDVELDKARAAGVTPAIQFYYWGDDISPTCLEAGCWSSLHGAQKDQAGWSQLATQLGQHLTARLGGRAAVIILETEFNKGSVATYEPLDAMLADKAAALRAGYPAAQVVLGLGNWGRESWGTWDRAAAASDLVGVQAMRGSTRDSLAKYQGVFDETLLGAQRAQALFGKPGFVTDLALSSYPEPSYLATQSQVVQGFFDRIGELKAAGVQGLLYRSLRDSPTMDTANYYGEAERHWGLMWANGTAKPAWTAWRDGVLRERGPLEHAPSASFSATVAARDASVDASGSRDLDGDALSYVWAWGDGSAPGQGRLATHRYAVQGDYWITLWVSDGALTAKTSKAVHVDDGAPVASFSTAWSDRTLVGDASASTDPDGDALSFVWAWGDGTSVSQGRTATHAYAARGDYPVTLWASDGALTAQASKVVHVDNGAPVASFSIAWSGRTLTGDASASSDPDGDALTYTWAWGDGTAPSVGATAAHAYAAEGDYWITLWVSDGSSTTETSQLVHAENRAPVATFRASSSGLDVAADASASSDADGDALSFVWAWGDGTARSVGATAAHAYAAEGDYWITLWVSDGSSTTETSQLVHAQADNSAPIASFRTSLSGMKMTGDASKSTDPEGDALTFRWAWGDGSGLSTGARSTHRYGKHGDYWITLWVSDGALTTKASKLVHT